MKRMICAVVASVVAGSALADCPTTYADAAEGVYVEFDGLIVRYDRRADGTVEEMEADTETGQFFRYLSHQGIFILESWEMQGTTLLPDSYEVITYDTPLPSQITANMSYRSMTTVRYGQDAPFQEPLEITVGAQRTQQIGDCNMAVLDVRMVTGPSNDPYVSNFIYFPALGFGSFTGGGQPDRRGQLCADTYRDVPACGPHRTPAAPAFCPAHGHAGDAAVKVSMQAHQIARAGSWDGPGVARLVLDYEGRFLRRKRLICEDGQAVMVDLAETVSLDPGDALVTDAGPVEIVAAPEALLRVTGDLPGWPGISAIAHALRCGRGSPVDPRRSRARTDVEGPWRRCHSGHGAFPARRRRLRAWPHAWPCPLTAS